MRRSYRGNAAPKALEKEFLSNEKITAPELMVIDEHGTMLGKLTRQAALEEARKREYDLVEVSPKAVPPVARIMDYGSYRYQKAKSERKAKAKAKTIEVKTVKVSSRISDHDIEVRVARAVEFLSEGDKVKIELQLRGREHQHPELARKLITDMVATITARTNKPLKTEQALSQQGSRFSTVISS